METRLHSCVLTDTCSVPAASTRCSSQSSPRPTTSGTTGHPRVTASECSLWAHARACAADAGRVAPPCKACTVLYLQWYLLHTPASSLVTPPGNSSPLPLWTDLPSPPALWLPVCSETPPLQSHCQSSLATAVLLSHKHSAYRSRHVSQLLTRGCVQPAHHS